MTTEPREESPGEGAPYARRMSRESSISYMDCLFSVLAGSEQTDGRFGLMEMVAPKGREPSRHLHHTDDEGFYVLEGELTFYVGEEVYEASPGTFVFLPHGIPHSYTFQSGVVRMLSIIAPGGLERHFLDPRFSEPAEGTTLPPPAEAPDPELLEAMSKDLASYGTEVVGPPGPPRQA
jgi:quercetin dioxygenase-like cupin family protein